ncbi:HD-GYP domain, c-di-GMP phosphodiesterase class II (or its inactivated variant) [Peptoclostridium litorale DSM 5388]|uniref:Metal dependent phosphohydrolase n=1 Tax=Peptoclostridium litorale DSM 5388 TaxID=1121324 RepID=A0A069RH44_PEPLI|nr:HD domain-containing phosphohydrolase [Peptoclostridium litorale]KDR96331.1 metal dependent phosphohydrolase [Peptoclostridium litorale DSM 5388]SIO26501.1 HD-GYP domain, c-di-GMP phosphodiesterase class II (or its inactivated variant) [Peptoclostridium litorale DSM 5388]
MYRNIRNILIMSALVLILTVSFSIVKINHNAWNMFKGSYSEAKKQQIEFFIEQHFDNLEDILNPHAVWTDSVLRLKAHDSQWLYENATGYIVDEEQYNVDFIYVTTEDADFKRFYGKYDMEPQIKASKSFGRALHEDERVSEVIWIGKSPALVIASPFFDNDKKNPSGCYFIGRILGEKELSELVKVLTENEEGRVTLTRAPEYKTMLLAKHSGIKMSIPMLSGQNENYVNVILHIEYLDYIFNTQRNFILGILIITTLALLGFAVLNLKKLANKLGLVIKTVEEISDGNYHSRISSPGLKLMPEVDNLIQAVNKMSYDVELHIEIIEEHANAMDKKYVEMIGLVVNAVEMNDAYTYRHSVSVSKYALMIGKAIGYEDLENLELAAKLHDVGKIAIPTDILNKPGKLTKEEYEIIKGHPAEGYRLVNQIDIFETASQGILYHHERYDGGGYPEGLKGDQIPIIAQIISVADVYEALTSDRSYRKAMSSSDAMKILKEEAGKGLNPELVDVFCEEVKKPHCQELKDLA